MTALQFERVPSGGAGNKMLMLLECKGGAYIQDRGVSRWDTCGAQAVLEAHGGVLSKLTSFAQHKQLASYTYLHSAENADFEPDTAYLTAYNAMDKGGFDKKAAKRRGTKGDFAPYANLCGLLALHKDNVNQLDRIHEAVLRAQESAGEISYD
ncbi:hypothetical protein EON64_06725 [archaeon]|nr:MAG: hypothetical protein EON64_06725 [archaeon]